MPASPSAPGASSPRASLAVVKSAPGGAEQLDVDLGVKKIPEVWARLREEARPVCADMSIWRPDLVPMGRM